MGNEIVLSDGEVIETQPRGALAAITQAEVSQGIESARRYRRSIDLFMRTCTSMVSYSPAVAGKFRFVLPKKGQDGQPISGVSVHGAKMLASAWGNLRVGGTIVEENDRYVLARGVCHDLETNVLFASEVRVPIVDRHGRRYSDDMIKNAAGAAISKATRNAILSVIPSALVEVIEEEAIRVAQGSSKSLPERVSKAISWFVNRGIEESRILAAVGVEGRGDINLGHITTLQGFRTAIEEGARAEELFPKHDLEQDTDKGHKSRSEALAETIGRHARMGGRSGRQRHEEPVVDVFVEENETFLQEGTGATAETEHVGREPGEDG